MTMLGFCCCATTGAFAAIKATNTADKPSLVPLLVLMHAPWRFAATVLRRGASLAHATPSRYCPEGQDAGVRGDPAEQRGNVSVGSCVDGTHGSRDFLVFCLRSGASHVSGLFARCS